MKISLVISTRDNLKYLKWSYDSIRKNQGNHEVWICYGIDHCTDGTQDWIEEIKKVDPFVKSIENKTGTRLGHTIMYDRIVNEIVDTDIAMIFHSDMYLCPEAIDSIEGLFQVEVDGPNSKNGTRYWLPVVNRVVSLTRIEPPLHPDGPEKVLWDLGSEVEAFDEQSLLYHLGPNLGVSPLQRKVTQIKNNGYSDLITSGVFAPWAFWVDEFKAIGGHDALFAPQSKEDSDIFNRFKLNGCEFIQTWNGFVYHLTCRGSRFNPTLTEIGKNSPEWERQNQISSRNFIRKWGHFVKHDEYLHPIIPHKYNIGFILQNPTFQHIYDLEPWCQRMVCPTLDQYIIDRYVELEQPNTPFDLKEKLEYGACDTEIVVQIDAQRFDQNDYQIIQYLSQIIEESGQIGEFEIGNLKITIRKMNTYEHELIVCKNEPINLN